MNSPDEYAARFIMLEQAAPYEQAAIAEQLAKSHPEGILEAPLSLGRSARLANAQLEHSWFPKARLDLADLSGANLQHAMLGGSRLDGAMLERADFRKADLSECKLRGAEMGESRLEEALLEDCDLSSAKLRFAHLSAATAEGANCAAADMWGADLDGLFAPRARFAGTIFGESSGCRAVFDDSDFSGATISKMNFAHASFARARFDGAILNDVVFREARLQGARLLNLDLTTCTLDGASFAGAYIEHCVMRRDQLGALIGEERSGDWAAAATGYFALERNFAGLGDNEAARWAYLKKRRMVKRAHFNSARAAARAGRGLESLRELFRASLEQSAETVCDYGESVERVMASIIMVFITFAILYGVLGGVINVEGKSAAGIGSILTFSLLAMTTLGTPDGLQAANAGIDALRGVEAFAAIFLTGLLGFVAGNRIRS